MRGAKVSCHSAFRGIVVGSDGIYDSTIKMLLMSSTTLRRGEYVNPALIRWIPVLSHRNNTHAQHR